MVHVSVVHVGVAGTDVAAGYGPRSDPRAATTLPSAFRVHGCMAESVSTAFVTVSARAHDCFGLFELIRATHAAAHERTGMLGAPLRICTDSICDRESCFYVQRE